MGGLRIHAHQAHTSTPARHPRERARLPRTSTDQASFCLDEGQAALTPCHKQPTHRAEGAADRYVTSSTATPATGNPSRAGPNARVVAGTATTALPGCARDEPRPRSDREGIKTIRPRFGLAKVGSVRRAAPVVLALALAMPAPALVITPSQRLCPSRQRAKRRRCFASGRAVRPCARSRPRLRAELPAVERCRRHLRHADLACGRGVAGVELSAARLCLRHANTAVRGGI
jgi:hypothetical protein